MQEEIWVDIPEYENLYQISNLGRIKSLKRYNIKGQLLREKILNPYNSNGYKGIWLYKDGAKKFVYVDNLYHRIFEKEG